MAEQVNWRELYEDKDLSGDEVVEVLEHKGTPLAYFYRSKASGNVHVAEINEHNLVKKPKPKSYRPFKAGEVKCGDVFVNKSTGNEWLVIGVINKGLSINLNSVEYLVSGMLDGWTRLDGSPAGILE